MKGNTITPPNSWNGPKEMETSGSTLSCSPSQSLARRQRPDHPGTWYYLEIQVILTEDRGTTPPPPHAWQAPVMEDMLWDGKSGLTEAVVMGPGQAILFYGRQSLGEGLSLGKVCDTTFMLLGTISWVGKLAQLNTNVLILQEGWQLRVQTITKWHTEAIGLGHPCCHLPPFLPCRFHNHDGPLQEERLQSTDKCVEEPKHTHWTSHHDQGWVPQHGWDCGQMQWDPWAAMTSSPLPDHRFESDRSSVSTCPSVSSRSNRSGGSRHMHCGQCCREPEAHMKINLPVFKGVDKKDASLIKVGTGI